MSTSIGTIIKSSKKKMQGNLQTKELFAYLCDHFSLKLNNNEPGLLFLNPRKYLSRSMLKKLNNFNTDVKQL